MSVNLISSTPDAEATILYIARVSSDQTNEKVGLLKYLIRNKHWSPFEMAHMTLEIFTSRAIAQQILRHRSFSFQEFSQRYASPSSAIFYTGRKPADKNRQSSSDELDPDIQGWWIDLQKKIHTQCFAAYNEAIEIGVARECARFILPLATATKLYMSGSLRSWIHYIELRTDEHTQLEHRLIALEARNHFIELFPLIASALEWDLTKPSGSATVAATPQNRTQSI